MKFQSFWNILNRNGVLDEQFIVFNNTCLGRHLDLSLDDIGIVEGCTLEIRNGVNPNHGVSKKEDGHASLDKPVFNDFDEFMRKNVSIFSFCNKLFIACV